MRNRSRHCSQPADSGSHLPTTVRSHSKFRNARSIQIDANLGQMLFLWIIAIIHELTRKMLALTHIRDYL
jgi:hypothetical protein